MKWKSTKDGYLKLHRKMINWQWYREPNTKILFIHLMITASYKSSTYCGLNLKPGSRACTVKGLSDECGLTVKNIRTAIEHLKESGEINVSVNPMPKFMVITLNNWKEYQAENEKAEKPKASKNKVPKIHQERFGNDYEAYIKWWHETTGQ